jgi:hypothetical protein
MEVIAGKGVLGQLGINPLAVKGPFLAGFLFLLVGGLLGGYVVINNPPDTSKAPPNEGDGLPRNPLKTYDPQNIDPLTTYTRGGVVDRPSGQVMLSLPYCYPPCLSICSVFPVFMLCTGFSCFCAEG